MTKKDIDKILQNHEKRIFALEASVGKPKKQKTKMEKQSLSDHIIELRDDGFFSQPKIAKEVHTKLTGKYNCELNRVEVALKKIADRKELRRTSKIISDKKYKAYVW